MSETTCPCCGTPCTVDGCWSGEGEGCTNYYVPAWKQERDMLRAVVRAAKVLASQPHATNGDYFSDEFMAAVDGVIAAVEAMEVGSE